jgi:uncharacterized repeat protein (TIGR04138 family)
MHEMSFDEAVEKVVARDTLHGRESYYFLREALDFTQKNLGKDNQGRFRHVSVKELLEGIREFALAEYGPMAITVFEEWGIRSGRDFGEIVFNLIDIGFLLKTEHDSRASFEDCYDFYSAFSKPFLPAHKQRKEPAEAKTSAN